MINIIIGSVVSLGAVDGHSDLDSKSNFLHYITTICFVNIAAAIYTHRDTINIMHDIDT
jgi:hypothetical protein